MGKIVVVGSSNTDLVVRVKEIPAPGETVIGEDYYVNPGGKGANQAVAVARLGGDCAFVTKVGDDEYGRRAIRNFEAEGIDAGHVFMDKKAHTGTAFIVVDDKGENAITVSSGANARLLPSDVDTVRDLIEAADIVLMQLEIPVRTIEHVAEIASAKGARVILNPAPAVRLEPSLLSRLYMITPNETECEILTGISTNSEAGVCEAAKRLMDEGIKNVIVTRGRQGSTFCGAGGQVDVPAICQKKVVDTTAAGDVYIGALCVALAEGRPIPEAMAFATAASSIAVTRRGAQPSIPTREEAEALLRTNGLLGRLRG